MWLSDNGNMSFKELENMVRDINANEVLPQDKLSDTVYHYDSKDKIFEKASGFADRRHEKSQNQTKQQTHKKTLAEKLNENKDISTSYTPKPKRKKMEISM